MRLILLCASALLLAGCVSTTSSVTAARPKTIVVSDLVFGPNVVAVDRSFTARLERKIGSFPTHERKQRTNERVNDEIVAAMIATLREGGLEAMPARTACRSATTRSCSAANCAPTRAARRARPSRSALAPAAAA
jgi:hypothetical protein